MNKNFDWIILICTIILCSFGAVAIGSVAPSLLPSQIFFYFLGIILFFIFSKIDYKIFFSFWRQIYILALGLLVLTLFFGFESNGAVRWISILGLKFQFSELFKPFLIISILSYLSEKQNFLKAGILALIPVLLIFRQPDLGSALIYSFGFASLFFLSGINMIYVLLGVGGGALLFPIFWHFLADYQKHRFFSFINPKNDPLGTSYNAIQATIAVGSGMFLGWGLGRGTQSQLLFLPEHHTDFIFASLAEELGFLGASVLLIVFFVLLWRIFRIKHVLASSLGVMLMAQVFINVGMNLAIVPVTGITLPLVSYGGASVLATMITLGIIENIASCYN